MVCIQPFGDRVVLKVLLPEEKKEGDLLVTLVSKDTSNEGEVVAVGESVELIKIGDKVLFNTGMGMAFSTEDEDYLIFHTRDIVGKIIG